MLRATLNQRRVGRVTPCAPGFDFSRDGAHGVTRPTEPGAMVCWSPSFSLLPRDTLKRALQPVPRRKPASQP